MEPLKQEQLRGVVQARIAELDAYKYMEQVLGAVEEAEARKAEAQKHVDALAKEYDDKADALELLSGRYEAMNHELDHRYNARLDSWQSKMAVLDAEMEKKQKALDAWQEHLAKVESAHKENLAQWQVRIQKARDEYKAMQDKLAAVKKQYESFAAMVKG